jgi:Carboxypeptidase regulatory-like domain/TonB dependent receptor-like, beta-barrel
MKSPALGTLLLFASVAAFAQTEGARISGRVTDQSDAVIVGAECTITNLETGVSITVTTNEDGIYVIPNLHPATYRLTIQMPGFRSVIRPDLQLYVQDALNENFTLAVGPASESVTVAGDDMPLQTDSAAVSTLVNERFVQNTPLNGRSFQPLIALTPGIVFTSQRLGQGQFSSNGQRSNANYFTVDGVSANFGATLSGLGQALGGAIPGFTAQGGTNGLVSVDAMQEFRIQTSSYEAEFGRTPGAQISIVTKSGGNQFHGTAFDYLRNDVFDARNYFDTAPLTKPPLRQNDFGGTLGGRIRKDKTFFFFSYEGLRLRLPQTAADEFLTASARAAVAPAYQPIVNALPLPNSNAPLIDPSCNNITNPCLANLAVAYSDPSSLNAVSIRIDQSLSKKITLFVRYNHAPSYSATRNWEELEYNHTNSDTLTAGATILLVPNKVNDFRVNWSRSTDSDINSLTDFHGAVAPPASALFPPSTGYSPEKGQFLVFLDSIGNGDMEVRDGTLFSNIQRQINLVDTFSWAVGAHQLKFGVDYRHLNPTDMADTGEAFFPSGYTDLTAGTAGSVFLTAGNPISLSADNYSLFAQDTWKATSRLTLTYGLRWEINTPPVSATPGKPLYALQGIFDANPLALVPGPLWHTRFTNFAPRIGAAYQLTPKAVVRGGFGVFYDLGYGDVGAGFAFFPYTRSSLLDSPSLPFDLSSPAFQPPPFSTAIDASVFQIGAVDPNLRTPFTLQWNAAIEQALGAKQKLTVTYVGSDGRDLLREDSISLPLAVGLGSSGSVDATRNAGYSHYEALQLQLQRAISRGLQALVSYNFAKSSDTQSTDAAGVTEGESVSRLVLSPSDFDIRHSLAAAVSYEIPTPSWVSAWGSGAWGRASKAVLGGWAVDGILRVSSAPPINVTVFEESPVLGIFRDQADIVPGQPFWIPDPTQPSGKALNPAAFTPPPLGQEGDFPRNGLRSPYSIDQTDLALRRRFNLTERVKLDVRAEYFNVFNHPMFGIPGSQCNPATVWGTEGSPALSSFGKLCAGTSTTNVDAGGSNGQVPLYAVGGPRSAQFTLKLLF